MNGDYKALPQPSSENRRVKKLGWFLQIAVWLSLGLGIYYFISSELNETKPIYKKLFVFIPFIILYILFIIYELYSQSFHDIMKQKHVKDLEEVLPPLVTAKPEIEWEVECYHYKTKNYSTIEDGRRVQETREIQVTTHQETKRFNYYSCRDVSGTYYIDIEQSNLKNISYIKLSLAKSLFFADAISYSDYKAEKEEFQRKNKERDQLFSFKENITIPGFETDIMVRINGNSKLCSGIGFYILWTIIPFVEFYKLYFKNTYMCHSYHITKVISSRYNLLDEDYSTAVENYNPIIRIGKQVQVFNTNDICYINESNKRDEPTQSELIDAERFKTETCDKYLIQRKYGEKTNTPVITTNAISNNTNDVLIEMK